MRGDFGAVAQQGSEWDVGDAQQKLCVVMSGGGASRLARGRLDEVNINVNDPRCHQF